MPHAFALHRLLCASGPTTCWPPGTPATAPASLDFDAAAQWLGLEVRGHWVKDADHAEVEFVARHRLGGRAVRLHERSRFVREGGRWYYVDGDMLPVR